MRGYQEEITLSTLLDDMDICSEGDTRCVQRQVVGRGARSALACIVRTYGGVARVPVLTAGPLLQVANAGPALSVWPLLYITRFPSD